MVRVKRSLDCRFFTLTVYIISIDLYETCVLPAEINKYVITVDIFNLTRNIFAIFHTDFRYS